MSLQEFKKIIPKTFIYEPILMKINVNANIKKTQRSLKVTKGHLYVLQYIYFYCMSFKETEMIKESADFLGLNMYTSEVGKVISIYIHIHLSIYLYIHLSIYSYIYLQGGPKKSL